MKLLFSSLVLVFLLSACSPSSTTLPTKTKTQVTTSTPKPKFTATPVTLPACVTDSTIRIRSGPSTEHEAIGGLVSGTCVTIIGRNSQANWVRIVAADNVTGWVNSPLLTIQGDLMRVSVISSSEIDSVQSIVSTPTNPLLAAFASTATPTVVLSNPFLQPTALQLIPLCSHSAESLNTEVTCKLERAYCVYRPDVNESPTFCNDKPYPNHVFQLVAFGEDWSFLDGECLIVSGSLEMYFNGQETYLQIIAYSLSQILYC